MAQLWLVPVDEIPYQRTLAEPVDLSDREDKPAAFPDRTRVWGVRTDPEQGDWERNRRNLDLMERGDLLLFYRKERGRYTDAGRVGPFWHTTYVRDEFWNGNAAVDVFAIEDHTEVDMSRFAVNRLLGYNTDFHPRGLIRVADDRPVDRVRRRVTRFATA